MVRLQGFVIWRYRQRTQLFQFQNGAITRCRLLLALFVVLKFQFQNGAITSYESTVGNGFNTLFQFQNGAITRKYLRSYVKVSLCFNSKMVRLQVHHFGVFLCVHSVSIPKWCDYKGIIGADYLCAIIVSIPKWCDYKPGR